MTIVEYTDRLALAEGNISLRRTACETCGRAQARAASAVGISLYSTPLLLESCAPVAVY